MATEATSPQTAPGLSGAFPIDSRLNERGCVEVGGCDVLELAQEYGTPAYVVAEQDLRARARAFVQAGRRTGHADMQVVYASKSFPCTAVLRLFAEEQLWCDVASAGELHLALCAGFAPERIVLHGNAKSAAELHMALECGVGLIAIDNFDEISRLEQLVRNESQDVLIRVTPDVSGDTHEHISTGQADSKFGFSMADAPGAIARVQAVDGLRLVGLHAHIGSQLCELEPFRREVAELARARRFPRVGSRRRAWRAVHLRAAATALDRGLCPGARRRRGRARHGPGLRRAPTDRARPCARGQRGRDAVHRGVRQAERLALGRRRRGDV